MEPNNNSEESSIERPIIRVGNKFLGLGDMSDKIPVQLDKPIETELKKKRKMSFPVFICWLIIDILLLGSGHAILFLLVSTLLLWGVIAKKPLDQSNNVSAPPAEYTLSENKKCYEIPAYRVGDSLTAQPSKYKEGPGYRLVDKSTAKTAQYTFAEIDEMDGFKFEKYMKHVFESLGYSVHHTQLSGDQGADLILTSSEGIRTAVQVKRYSSKVSNGAVQEVVAAKGLYRCTQGMVVTNSYFTDSAKQLAKANGIELIDRDELKKLINKVLHTVIQDPEWLQHFHRSSSLLNSYLPRIKTDFKNLSYTTLASFDSEIKKAMDENSEYTTSPRFVDARKEWGAALLDFNAAGVYSTLHPKGGKICDVTNPEACANLKALLESGFSHLSRANAAIEVAVLDNLNLKEKNYSEERASSIEDTLKLTFK